MPTPFTWTTLAGNIITLPPAGTVETWPVALVAQFPVGGDVQVRAQVDGELVYATAVTPTTLSVQRGAEGTTVATHQVGAPITALISNPIQPDGDLWASPAYGFDLTGGTDNTALLQQLINAIPQSGPVQGGRIRFLPESIIRIDGQVDLTSLQNISFVGPNATGQNVVPAILRFTRNDNQPCIKLWQSTSIAFRNLWFETTGPLFSGALFDVMVPPAPIAVIPVVSRSLAQLVPPGRQSPSTWQSSPRRTN